MTLRPDCSSPEKLRILLTGSSGQIGGDLLTLLSSFAEVIAPTRAQLDLSSEASLRAFVRSAKPNWIINPAAFTSVEKAESESSSAYLLNARAPKVLGEEAARCGAALIHFSTDYVFDGGGTRPWSETDVPNPLNVYGATKLEGERAITRSESAHLILRTSWVFGARGTNFLRTILTLAAKRDELRIVSDQFGAPSWSFHLAQAVQTLIRRTEEEATLGGVTAAQALAPKSGIYHAASAGVTTWFGFAEEFLQHAKASRPRTHFANLIPIATCDFPTAARRPLNSRLNCTKLREAFDIELPDWRSTTSRVMSVLQEEHSETS